MRHVRFEPMRDIETIVDQIGGFLNQVGKGVSFEVGGFVPRIDVEEDEKNTYIHAELPGMKKEDVKITLNEDGTLTLSGEKKEVKQENKKAMRRERSYGAFSRSIVLPGDFQAENISAEFVNGILTITVPKVEPVKPKEYTVNIN